MPRRPLEPAPGTSETALRPSSLVPLVIQGVLGVMVFSPLLLGGDDDLDVVRLWLLALWATAFVALIVQFRALGSWRSDSVREDETILWGTSAVLVRPTGGLGHGGASPCRPTASATRRAPSRASEARPHRSGPPSRSPAPA